MYRLQLILYSTSCKGRMIIMQNTVRENLLQIQEDIAPCKPNIIAVTKYFDENTMIEAYKAGLRDFAESRAVEAVKKIENLPAEVRNNSRFHFIGHLQTNKVKKVVPVFDYIHSVANMALLNMRDNAALSNSTFDVKRNEIIRMDKEGKYYFCIKRTDYSDWDGPDVW